MRNLLCVLIVILLAIPARAQGQDTSLIQFSGVILTSDSLHPIPFTHILIDGSRKGTTSDYYGFFSFVARKGDRVIFSSVGYKKAYFTIPDSITKNRYSIIQVMFSDTVMLSETFIYPWPTREQFKQAFLTAKIPDDDLERAKKNLAHAEMKQRMENYGMDGNMNYRHYINQQFNKAYYAGQMPPNNLLNPFAWAQFIKAWQEGKFKRKDYSDD